MLPLVTISIPIYQCEQFIENCLNSVLAQTYPLTEVSLINDCAQDKSREIAEKFIQIHQPKTWKIVDLEENSGLSAVRNAGINLAKGKYIFFLDSDDEIDPTCIEDLVNMAEKFNLQMVVGDVEAVQKSDRKVLDLFPVLCDEDILKGNSKILQSFVKGEFPVVSWNKLINLGFLKTNQLYFLKGVFAQDSLHTFQMALKLESTGFLRKKTYRYLLHSDSVIHNRGARHFENWIRIAKEIDRAYLEERDQQKRDLILEYLVDFKSVTLEMNWKAKKDEMLWKRSYSEYFNLKKLSANEMFSPKFSLKTKKQNFFTVLPKNLAFKVFKWRYER